MYEKLIEQMFLIEKRNNIVMRGKQKQKKSN